MDTTNHPVSQSPQPPAQQEAYIGEEPLRLLARLIARDILHKRASLKSADIASVASLPPQKPLTGKDNPLP